MHTSIKSAIPVLQFNGPQGVLPGELTYQAYQDLAISKFQSLVDEVGANSPGFREGVVESGFYADREFVLSPEIWNLGRRVERSQVDYIVKFVQVAIAAEKARRGEPVTETTPLWSVNGEVFVRPGANGQDPFVYRAPVILDTVSMDFLSPYCVYMDNEQLGEPEGVETASYELDDIEKLASHFNQSMAPIERDWDQLRHFIKDYTRHMVLKVNPHVQFSSGSSRAYVGRTVICNAESVPEPMLAEAIVHEAVHSYLYMLEELVPWMPARRVSNKIGTNVPSVWTGNKISLMSFGQAVFVWYSLYNFWMGSIERDFYNREMVTKQMDFIRAGFDKLSLDWFQEISEGTVPEDTMEAVRLAKAFVLAPQPKLSLV